MANQLDWIFVLARPRPGERKPEPVCCLNLAKYSIADFRCACSIGHSGLKKPFAAILMNDCFSPTLKTEPRH